MSDYRSSVAAEAGVSDVVHAVAMSLEEAWATGPPPDLRRFLPPPGPARVAAALELALIDRERRLAASLPVPDYLNALPELTDCPGAVTELAKSSCQSSPPVPDLTVFGYLLREEVGRGGMGVVYRATDLTLGRETAVKFLRPDIPVHSAAGRRFREEARVTGQLQHPGIPAVHQFGTLPDGRPFLAMRLIGGRTLEELLPGRLAGSDPGRLVAAFEQVSQTVGYAHSRGVVHRDLKPSNVMVGAFGEVQVMDWGLARAAGERSESPNGGSEPRASAVDTGRAAEDATQHGQFLGTPAYMAPEQATGPADRVGERADVFGLGGILCAILTGQPPYVGPSAHAVRLMAAHGRLDEAFVRLEGCGADRALVSLCKRCLSPDPADRPADGGEVARLVAGLRAQAEDRARRAERERAAAEARAMEGRKRLRAQLALVVTLGLLIAAAGGFAWWSDRQTGRERERQLRADAERAASDARTGEAVEAAIRLAAVLRGQARFTEARTALDQAGALIGQAEADRPALRSRLAGASDALAVVVALDQVRALRSSLYADENGRNRLDQTRTPVAYRQAFAAHGYDVINGPPETVGDRIRGSEVRSELVAGLDDWSVFEPDPAVCSKVMAVARHADPSPWRDRFRDPSLRADPAGLARLAEEAAPTDLTPSVACALAELLRRGKSDPTHPLKTYLYSHPSDFMVAFTFAVFAGERGDHVEQLSAFRIARALRPGDPVVANNQGVAMLLAGNTEGGRAALEAAIREHPCYANLRYNLGVTLLRAGEHVSALREFQEAHRLEPANPRILNNLGTSLARAGKPAEAEAVLRKAVEIDGHDPKNHVNLAIVLEKGGNLEEAIEHYRRTMELDRKHAQAANNLGVCLVGLKRTEEAITAYQEAIRRNPGYARAHFNLGFALDRVNDVKGAVAALETALRLPADPRDGAFREKARRYLDEHRKKGDVQEPGQPSNRSLKD
jgi:Tfp pilus assembly protein PilF